jgi:hypothetical protein
VGTSSVAAVLTSPSNKFWDGNTSATSSTHISNGQVGSRQSDHIRHNGSMCTTPVEHEQKKIANTFPSYLQQLRNCVAQGLGILLSHNHWQPQGVSTSDLCTSECQAVSESVSAEQLGTKLGRPRV